MKETKEQAAQRIVSREVRYCMSSLISELATNDKYSEELFEVMSVADCESACYDAGYRVVKCNNGLYTWLANDEMLEDYSEGHWETEIEAWTDCAADNEIEAYQLEVFEHWAVTEWLGKKLQERGEVVIDFFGVTIWGRTTTGQAIYSDNVIERIVEDILHD